MYRLEDEQEIADLNSQTRVGRIIKAAQVAVYTAVAYATIEASAAPEQKDLYGIFDTPQKLLSYSLLVGAVSVGSSRLLAGRIFREAEPDSEEIATSQARLVDLMKVRNENGEGGTFTELAAQVDLSAD